MSGEDLPKPPTQAVPWFVSAWALGAVAEGWSNWHGGLKESAVIYWLVAAVIACAAGFWAKIQKAAGPRFAESAAKVVSDFRSWVVVVAFVLIMPTFTTLFLEGHWPFEAWLNKSASTVIRDRTYNQEQLDEKVVEATKPLNAQILDFQRQIKEARTGVTVVPPTEIEKAPGPIIWDVSNFVLSVENAPLKTAIDGIMIQGKGGQLVQIKYATITSLKTGRVEELKVHSDEGWISVSDSYPVPKEAQVQLGLFWSPAITLDEFRSKWCAFHVHIEYEKSTFDTDFDDKACAAMIENQIPALEPMVTKRKEKQ